MKQCLSPFRHPKEIPVASLVFLGFLALITFDLMHLSLFLHLQKLLLWSTVSTSCSSQLTCGTLFPVCCGPACTGD